MQHLRQSGFTLMELMIVVAIVAILGAIAYPAYQDQMRKSRRAEAMSTLQDLALQQESWRANDSDYATLAELGASTTGEHYTFSTQNLGASTYTIVATATGDQANDSACTPLTINQSNERLPASCW